MNVDPTSSKFAFPAVDTLELRFISLILTLAGVLELIGSLKRI